MVLTGPVPFALTWLMIKWGFAVQGQRVRRWSSHSRSIWWVSSSIGRTRPAMVSRRLPRSTSSTSRRAMMADVLAGVHAGQHQDESGDRGLGDLDDVVHLALVEGLGDAVGVLTDPDASGRVAEDQALLLAEGEQRPQRAQDVAAA